jgi:hypothetical protein
MLSSSVAISVTECSKGSHVRCSEVLHDEGRKTFNRSAAQRSEAIGPRRLFAATITPETQHRLQVWRRSELVKAVNKITVQHAVKFVYGLTADMLPFVQKSTCPEGAILLGWKGWPRAVATKLSRPTAHSPGNEKENRQGN